MVAFTAGDWQADLNNRLLHWAPGHDWRDDFIALTTA